MSPKIKKVLTYSGGGLLVILLLLVVAGMVFEPPAPSGQASSPGTMSSGDPRLDELRERNQELDEVFDANSADFAEPDTGDDVFASVGQLSNFDDLTAEEKSVEEPSSVGDDPFSHEGPDAFSEREETINDPDDVLISEIEALSETQAFGQPVAPLGAMPSGIAEQDLEQVKEDMLAALTSLELQLRDDIDQLDLNLKKEAATQIDTELPALREQVLALQASQERLVELFEESSDQQALSERIENLERKQQQRSVQAQRPSNSTLRNLYRLKRIEGNTAVLIGQNTGTRFTFVEGDSLAYGGTLSVIRGDSVTLRWPSTSVTLSIY